jgi:putative permease
MVANGLANWYRKFFSDPHAVGLALFLLALSLLLWLFGSMLVPVLASLVIAYLLESPVQKMCRLGVPRLLSVLLVFGLFLAVVVLLLVVFVPLLSGQLGALVNGFPKIIQSLHAGAEELISRASEWMPFLFKDAETVVQEMDLQNAIGSIMDATLADRIQGGGAAPELLQQSRNALNDVMAIAGKGLSDVLSYLLSFLSFRSVMKAITLLVYLVLMPILVFFFLKDKNKILAWLEQFMPGESLLVRKVWHEVDLQIGNYVRGKCVEIVIVGSAAFVTFVILDLRFAVLLSVLVGLSVLIPYVGATVVTLPVFILGFAQYGWSAHLAWLMAAYGIIQLLDGNLLVPLLFSEAVDLHPTAIIVAILIFGGLWGFWGIFFAIPLATLVQAVLRSWPRVSHSLHAADPPDYFI